MKRLYREPTRDETVSRLLALLSGTELRQACPDTDLALEQPAMNRRSSADNASSTRRRLATFASLLSTTRPAYADVRPGPKRRTSAMRGYGSEDLYGFFPKCIHHSAVSAARFQPFPFSFYLRLCLSPSPPTLAFVELPAFCFKHDTAQTRPHAHSRSRPPLPSFSLSLSSLPPLLSALQRGSSFCSFFALVSSLAPPFPHSPSFSLFSSS